MPYYSRPYKRTRYGSLHQVLGPNRKRSRLQGQEHHDLFEVRMAASRFLLEAQ